jgi:hypothetical protein
MAAPAAATGNIVADFAQETGRNEPRRLQWQRAGHKKANLSGWHFVEVLRDETR